jgi:hypothetical protein
MAAPPWDRRSETAHAVSRPWSFGVSLGALVIARGGPSRTPGVPTGLWDRPGGKQGDADVVGRPAANPLTKAKHRCPCSASRQAGAPAAV